MIYSLLISERFKNANPDNILLYIMENPVQDGFEYLKQQKLELDSLILGRNELAKWQKLNSTHIDLPRRGQYFAEKFNKREDEGNLAEHNDIEDISKWD